VKYIISQIDIFNLQTHNLGQTAPCFPGRREEVQNVTITGQCLLVAIQKLVNLKHSPRDTILPLALDNDAAKRISAINIKFSIGIAD
jgi:hypothetical protein